MGLMLVAAAVSTLITTQQATVGGQNFVMHGERWYVVDDRDEEWEVCPGWIFVRFVSEEDPAVVAQTEPFSGLTLDRPTPIEGFYRFHFPADEDPIEVLSTTLSSQAVEAAFLDTYVRVAAAPSDTYYTQLWQLADMRAELGWSVTTGSPNVTIAILDVGFELTHEDLASNVWVNPNETPNDGLDNDNDALWHGTPYVDDIVGWDFIDNDNDPSPTTFSGDRISHGTSVAGMACATRDNGLGVAGIAGGSSSQRPRFAAIRVNSSGNVLDAIDYCLHKGFDILSMSWTNNDPFGLVHTLLDNAYASGVLLAAASGDQPAQFVYPPARYSSVIAVGGVGMNGAQLELSWGPEQELVAPAAKYGYPVELWTTDNYASAVSYNPQVYCACPADNPKYIAMFNGTSASCPEVAGLAALIMSHYPSLTNVQVRERLQKSAVDLGAPGWDQRFGYGRIDAYRALTEWGTLSGNVVWSSSDTHDHVRYVSGDLTIAPGATLTIMPGTIVRLASTDDLAAGSDPTMVEIKVQGTLIADGTAVSPITFERWGTSGNWGGIAFDASSGGGTLDYCMISDAETAVESYAPLIVKNSVISNCENAGVVSLAGGAVVHNCQLNSPGHIGIDLQSDEAVVRNSLVDGAVDYAVRVFANTVTTLKLRSSEFNNSGIGLFVNGNATVGVDSSCYFYHNDTGIHLYDSGSTVNIFRSGITWNPSGGIVCDGSSAPLIEENILAHNGGGIYCSNASSPRIQWNQIQSAGNAVTVTSDAAPDLGHTSPSGNQSTGNNKISNAAKYVVNNTSSAIYAQHNCWGVNSGGCNPATSKFTGSVDRSNPICCSFPQFSHGEGEPTPSEGFIFQSDPVSPERRERPITALVAIVPNPFNPNTTVHYTLASSTTVQISVYDVAGRLVQTLVDETEAGGQHTVEWKGMDRTGASVASGVCFVRMVTAGQTFTQKMVLLK